MMMEEAMIVKHKQGWVLLSQAGDKVLGGPYPTRKEAVDRERQVEFFKRLRELERLKGGQDGQA
jgi:hypothetical protein